MRCARATREMSSASSLRTEKLRLAGLGGDHSFVMSNWSLLGPTLMVVLG